MGGSDDYQWSFETDPALKKYGMGIPMEEEEEQLHGKETVEDQVVPIVDDQKYKAEEKETQSFTRISRSTSISSDEFFDANETLPFSDNSSYYDVQSAYATPGYLTPLGVTSPPPPTIPSELSQSLWLSISSSSSSSNHSNPFYSWTGLHMGAAFLTSFMGGRYPFQQQEQQEQEQQRQRQRSMFTINNDEGINGFALMDRLNLLQEQQRSQSEQDDEKVYMLLEDEGEDIIQIDQQEQQYQQHTPHFPHLLPPDVPQSAYALAPIRMQLQRMEHRFIRLTRRIFRLSFAYKGAIYWVVFYIFLRGPVEHALRRSLASVLTAPQRLSYTTIGITAAVAAAIGSSVTASVSDDDHTNRRRPPR